MQGSTIHEHAFGNKCREDRLPQVGNEHTEEHSRPGGSERAGLNLSGQSIAPAANFYKIPADHVIVLCDDITQEPGHLRIRPHGSAGGHNGLKSIIASLGTENFSRIRIGIGAKPNPQYDLAAWVLGKLPPADRKAMTDRYPDIEDACKLLMDGNLQYAQNKFNH